MDSNLRSITDNLIMKYDKADLVAIVRHINDHIRKCEESVKTLKAHLEERGVSKEAIERECAWRSAMLGLITKDEARVIMRNNEHICGN